MIVNVCGQSIFFGVPSNLGKPRADQDQGTNCERLIECAGRTCYDSYGKGRSSAEYHQHILEVGHGSVLEHASISFYISGVSRGCTHELVRHRAGVAISQRSTRYVDESESNWAWHPLLRGLEVDLRTGVEQVCKEAYQKLVTAVQNIMEGEGVDKLSARKQARGAARGILGNALETSLVWTANIRALRNFIEQRASKHADAEIRLLANQIFSLSTFYCPAYFADYQLTPCPDGIGFDATTKWKKV